MLYPLSYEGGQGGQGPDALGECIRTRARHACLSWCPGAMLWATASALEGIRDGQRTAKPPRSR